MIGVKRNTNYYSKDKNDIKYYENKVVAIEEFRSFGFEPIGINNWQQAKSVIDCLNEDNLTVRTSLSRLRRGQIPHSFVNNPHASENLKRIALKHKVKLVSNQKYVNYNKPYYGEKNGYIIKFSIDELMKGVNFSPFDSENEYVLKNIETFCKEHGFNIHVDKTQINFETIHLSTKKDEKLKNENGFFTKKHKDIKQCENIVFAINEFREFGFEPIGIKNWQHAKSVIECLNDDELIVRTSLSRLRSRQTPNPFKNNPNALENLKKIALQHEVELLPNQEYIDYNEPYYGEKDDFIIKFRIDGLLNGANCSPFATGNEYVFKNIETVCGKYGINISLNKKQTYLGTNHPVVGTDEEGYKYHFRVYDILNWKKPAKFHKSNPFTLENYQVFCTQHNIDLWIPQNQTFNGTTEGVLGVDSQGYKYKISIDSLRKGKKPAPFHKHNPYTIENIQTYCENCRPDYEILSNQIYQNAKQNLRFHYMGTQISKNVSRYFEMSWSNFKQGKGHWAIHV